MKRLLLFIFLTLVFSATGVRLAERHREERADRTVALIVEWPEVRDLAARSIPNAESLLRELRASGVRGILTQGVTLTDLAAQGRLHGLSNGVNPFAVKQLGFDEPELGRLAQTELEARGARGLTLSSDALRLSIRDASFASLAETEMGLDPRLSKWAHAEGLRVVLRLNRDPWMSESNARQRLGQEWGLLEGDALLMNTDDPPGGSPNLSAFKKWVVRRGWRTLLFEFRPTKAAQRVAAASPASTFRAHTIATNELKDLGPDQEMARWRRAVEERSCRFLLVHASPNDSLNNYLEHLSDLAHDLSRRGWTLGWPPLRMTWSSKGLIARASQALAWVIAVITPGAGLFLLWPVVQDTRSRLAALLAFVMMSAVTLAGASVVAALCQDPLFRLEVSPFRGIKAAFLISWLGSLLILFPLSELSAWAKQTLRRSDLLLGFLALAVVGYVLVRSGNATAGWKHPLEQGLRDHLEQWLLARPRFKEFAVGHPFALLGFLWGTLSASVVFRKASRVLVGIGMLGQISMVNSFCHLHSPIRLAYLRSVTGLVTGILIAGLVFGLAEIILMRYQREA